jgi:hypothetical protein
LAVASSQQCETKKALIIIFRQTVSITMLKLTTLLPLLALFKSAFGQDRSMDWFIPSDIEPFDSISMYAGDTLTFVYNGNHDVYIHPTGDCTQQDRIFVGAQFAETASYTFKDSEIDTDVTFACDYLNHCSFGLIINVLVLEPPPSAAPSSAPSVSPAPSMKTTVAPTLPPTVTPNDAPTAGDGDDKEPSAVAPAQGTLLAFFVAAFAMLM